MPLRAWDLLGEGPARVQFCVSCSSFGDQVLGKASATEEIPSQHVLESCLPRSQDHQVATKQMSTQDPGGVAPTTCVCAVLILPAGPQCCPPGILSGPALACGHRCLWWCAHVGCPRRCAHRGCPWCDRNRNPLFLLLCRSTLPPVAGRVMVADSRL